MTMQQYTYQDTLAAAQRAQWRIEDIIGDDRRLDFTKPFLPEPMARTDALAFLGADERLALNHIRAHGYLYMFGMVEEFILPFVLDHARPQLGGDDYRVRALLQFAAEEAKHIHLFKRFREEFTDGFGTECKVIGPPEDIARNVLRHHPLAVALMVLHIEWMTQRHYLDSVADDEGLDQQFKSLLKHHWIEEAQHAKLDTLMVGAIAETCAEPRIAAAVREYLEMVAMFDMALRQQVEYDVEALERATSKAYGLGPRARIVDVQQRAIRWTFLGSGMTHPNFLETVEAICPSARRLIEDVAPAFS